MFRNWNLHWMFFFFYFFGRMIGVGIVGGFTIINLWGNVFLGLVFFSTYQPSFGGKSFEKQPIKQKYGLNQKYKLSL